jgi:hypothetical protein
VKVAGASENFKSVELMPKSNRPDSLIAIALLVCVVAGCKQLQSLAKPTVLKSADGKFQITVPAGWRESALESDKAEIKAGNPLQEMYVLVMNERKADFTDDTTLDRYTVIVHESMRDKLTTPESTPPVELRINGNPARQYEIQGGAGNVKIAYLVTTVETSEHFHQIVTWTLRSHMDKNQMTLQKVTESFRPTPGQGGPGGVSPPK